MQERPSIQQLENFIIYGKVRNFATAAHRANITQSAFSFQMKKNRGNAQYTVDNSF